MKTIIKIIGLISLIGLLLSCAQQVSPSGGAKDTTPPKIKASSPENFSLNFDGNVIELKFDEFVKLNNIKQQLIVSPSVDSDLNPKLTGKKITLNLGDSLKQNTTYLINFGDGIVDWNEGNVLDSNLFVFSTGNYLDSLSINGVVKEAFTNNNAEGIIVMLYDTDYDSIPYKEIPTYFSKTDKNGKFKIDYLKPGTYKIIALKESNNNYLYDNAEEFIGFTENVILPDSNLIKLTVFQEKSIRNQYVESAKLISYGRVRLIFNEPTIDFKANGLNIQFKKAWHIEEMFTQKDTVDLWLTDTEGIDSLYIEVIDSISIDTLQIALNNKEKEEFLKIKLNTTTTGEIAPFKNLTLNFNEPIIDPNLENISFLRLKDSLELPVKIKSIHANQRQITLDVDLKEAENYTLEILPNQFKSIFGITNDTLKKRISVLPYNKFANLKLQLNLDGISTPSDQYILQLLDNSKKLIEQKTINQNSTETFINLNEGKYSLVLIFDENKNNQWDTGNYLKKKQPEKVIVYSEIIDVKPGWDMDITWKINN